MEEDNKGKSLLVPECKSSSSLEIRVFVFHHHDPSLPTLETTLTFYGYTVSKCQLAKEALSLLEEDKSRYDIIFSDAHLPDMDGFKLLEKVGSEMDLPVVLVLTDEEHDSILEGFVDGASGYVIKPITSDSLGHLGEDVSLKKENDRLRVLLVGDSDLQGIDSDDLIVQESLPAINDAVGKSSTLKRVKDERDEGDDEALYDSVKVKKPRLVWTPELRKKFELAMEELGEDDSVPKKILEKLQSMGVPNLTRENVASHLQKRRLQKAKTTNQTQTKTLLGLRPRMSLKQLYYTLDAENLIFQSCTSSDRPSFPRLALEYWNSGAMAFPKQRKIDPNLALDSSQVMGPDYNMVQQFGDHDGRLDNWTPVVTDNIFQSGNQTPEYYWNTNQRHQVNETSPSRLMFDDDDGDGYFPFGYRCESFVNTASTETNDAAMLQHLSMSRQFGFPDLQVQDCTSPVDSTITYGDNSFIDNANMGNEEFVNLGNNASYFDEPLVGNVYYQTPVQDDQQGFERDDFKQKPFIAQPGSGLTETK